LVNNQEAQQEAQFTVDKQEAQGLLFASMCPGNSPLDPPSIVSPNYDSEASVDPMVCSAEDVDIASPASMIRVADNLRGALSPISSVWMDLAVVVPVSEEVVVLENLPFFDLQFEKVEASN
jgi:hypothetical protein